MIKEYAHLLWKYYGLNPYDALMLAEEDLRFYIEQIDGFLESENKRSEVRTEITVSKDVDLAELTAKMKRRLGGDGREASTTYYIAVPRSVNTKNAEFGVWDIEKHTCGDGYRTFHSVKEAQSYAEHILKKPNYYVVPIVG